MIARCSAYQYTLESALLLDEYGMPLVRETFLRTSFEFEVQAASVPGCRFVDWN